MKLSNGLSEPNIKNFIYIAKKVLLTDIDALINWIMKLVSENTMTVKPNPVCIMYNNHIIII